MPMVDLVGQSYELDQTSLSPQRTINFYIEQYGDEDKDTKTPKALVPTPGATKVGDITDDPLNTCRGLYLSSSGPQSSNRAPRLYGVWGNDVYRFDENYQQSYLIGTVSDNGDPVSMIDNGFDFVLVDGEQMYKYALDLDDGESGWSTVDMPYVPGSSTEKIKPTHVAFLGQRLIVNNRYGNTWHFSKLGLTEFDTEGNLDFYSAEQSSDPILALRSVNGALWLFGNRSYEIWRTSDNQDDPYSYVGGSSSQIGIKAPKSLATVNDMVFWLGASDVGVDAVWMGTGNTAVRVSTMGIEGQIVKLSQREQAIAWCYASDGNIFYLLSFPYANRTFVYEHTTKTWHERLYRDLASAQWKVYPYQYGCYANNRIYCGTLYDSSICYLNKDKYTEWNGSQIVRQRISPIYYNELNNITMKEIMVDGQVGATELLTGQGYDPQIMLEISKDGGNSYGNIKSKSIGQQGNYRKAVRWNAQGIGRNLVLRFTISDPVPYTIYQARLDFEPCSRT